MSYDKVQVGNRIRGSRLEKGWTQERLAAEAEISVQQLRALEKGQRNLGVDHLGCLSDAMGVSSDFLLKGCSENKPGLGKGVSACLCFRRKGKD